MGQYSSCDIDDLDIDKNEGENDYLQYISNNIRTWKKNNLNNFISILSQGEKNNYNIFGIIEGNNGNEVSLFVKNHFLNELLNEIKIKKDVKIAIKESFAKINKLLGENEGMKEILDIRLKNNQEEINKYKKILKENNTEEKINIFEEEDKEILDYTGCTFCLIVIDSEFNEIYFGNIGNSEVFIYQNDNSDNIINLKSSHRPNDISEKKRINDNSLIVNNKLFGLLNSARTFGNFAYNGKKKIISDEPDIQEYDLNEKDKYIFIGNEAIINKFSKENIKDIIKKKEEIDKNCSLGDITEAFLDIKISNYFFNNDIKYGFDNMTFTLIKLKNK